MQTRRVLGGDRYHFYWGKSKSFNAFLIISSCVSPICSMLRDISFAMECRWLSFGSTISKCNERQISCFAGDRVRRTLPCDRQPTSSMQKISKNISTRVREIEDISEHEMMWKDYSSKASTLPRMQSRLFLDFNWSDRSAVNVCSASLLLISNVARR